MSDSEHDAGLSFSSDEHEGYSDLHDSDVEPPVQETRSSAQGVSTGAKEQPTRRRVLPAKLRMDGCVGVNAFGEHTRFVIVRCSQTGKQHLVKVRDLFNEDCSLLTEKDLTRGSSLMLDYKGKTYPVTFIQFKDESSSANNSGPWNSKTKSKVTRNENQTDKQATKKPARADVGKGPLSRDTSNIVDVLTRAKLLPAFNVHMVSLFSDLSSEEETEDI